MHRVLGIGSSCRVFVGRLPQGSRRLQRLLPELWQRPQSLPAHVGLGFELPGSTAHRVQHPRRDLETDASFWSRQEVSKEVAASLYELAMDVDRFAEKWMPSVAHFTNFVLGGIVLCGSSTVSATARVWRTGLFDRNSSRICNTARCGAGRGAPRLDSDPDPCLGARWVAAAPRQRFPAASMSGSMSKPRGLPSAIFCRALSIAASRPGGVWSFHQFIRSL